MRALVNTAPDTLEILDRPFPIPAAGQVRVRVTYCGICATDLEMIAGWERTGFPSVPGHEWTGVVDAVGEGGDASLVGQSVVAENIRNDGGEVGFEHSGGYGEYLIVEAHCVHPIPSVLDSALAPLIEPLAVSVRGIDRLRFVEGEDAIILGDGPIGLLLLLLARRRKAGRVVLVGGRTKRLEIAMKFGADAVINYHDTDISDPEQIGRYFLKLPAVVMEASGAASAMTNALNLTAVGGRILVIGDYASARAEFPWNQLLHRELELIGSNASAGGWEEAVQVAAEEQPFLTQLVTHRIPTTDVARGMELMQDRASGVIKIIMKWD